MRLKRHLFPAAVLAVLALAFVLVPAALAQFGLEEAAKGTNIPTTTKITTIIASILRAALGFVGTLFLLLMIYAGFLWMTARGDEKKVTQAKQLITGAVIGVIIIAGAYAITAFVLTAVTKTGAGESSGADTPAESCSPRSCTSASNCNVPGSGCYTGACICSGPGDPPTGGTTPCTVGSCGLVNP